MKTKKGTKEKNQRSNSHVTYRGWIIEYVGPRKACELRHKEEFIFYPKGLKGHVFTTDEARESIDKHVDLSRWMQACDLFPDAQFETDKTGQVIIYTNLQQPTTANIDYPWQRSTSPLPTLTL